MTLLTTDTSVRSSLCRRDPAMKPLPFKKRCHDKQSRLALESAMSLHWQVIVNHRRHLTKYHYHSNCFSTRTYGMPQLSATFLPTTVVEKKQVRFAPTATVNTRSVSHEDLNNSWYGEVDYRSFEEENRHTVGLIFCTGGDSSSLDPEHYSVLGLEQYAAGHRQMMTCRLKTLQHAAIVLEMYDVQRCSGIFDPEMVRRVSEWFSDEPVRRAQIRAAGSA